MAHWWPLSCVPTFVYFLTFRKCLFCHSNGTPGGEDRAAWTMPAVAIIIVSCPGQNHLLLPSTIGVMSTLSPETRVLSVGQGLNILLPSMYGNYMSSTEKQRLQPTSWFSVFRLLMVKMQIPRPHFQIFWSSRFRMELRILTRARGN